MGNDWDAAGSAEFQNFLDDLNFIDLPILGKRFTWFRPDGTAISSLPVPHSG